MVQGTSTLYRYTYVGATTIITACSCMILLVPVLLHVYDVEYESQRMCDSLKYKIFRACARSQHSPKKFPGNFQEISQYPDTSRISRQKGIWIKSVLYYLSPNRKWIFFAFMMKVMRWSKTLLLYYNNVILHDGITQWIAKKKVKSRKALWHHNGLLNKAF